MQTYTQTSIKTDPDILFMSPKMAEMREVLPTPTLPTTAVNDPFSIEKFKLVMWFSGGVVRRLYVVKVNSCLR